jgi:hypothetical protein
MFVKGNRSERERKDCQIARFSFSFSLEEREGRRVEEAWFKHARMKTTAFWGPLSPQKPNTMAFWGPLSPQKPNTAPFWGPLSSQKPNTTPFYINKFPTKFPTLDQPILFLSFFLLWFQWINGFGLFLQPQILILYYGLLYDNGFGLFK